MTDAGQFPYVIDPVLRSACYLLDLYCDRSNPAHGHANPLATFTGEFGSTCRRKARQRGWVLHPRRDIDVSEVFGEIAMTRIIAAMLILATSSAHAACRPVDGHPDQRNCDVSTLEGLKSDQIATEKSLAIATADAIEARKQREACEIRVKAIESAPMADPTHWQWFVAGGIAGTVIGVVATAIIVRAVR